MGADMISYVLLWFVLLGIVFFVYITLPLFSRREEYHDVDSTEARMHTLAIEKDQSYSALADLDEDFESGKLSEADYKTLRAELLLETANVVSQLEASAKSDVEAEIERYRKQKRGES